MLDPITIGLLTIGVLALALVVPLLALIPGAVYFGVYFVTAILRNICKPLIFLAKRISMLCKMIIVIPVVLFFRTLATFCALFSSINPFANIFSLLLNILIDVGSTALMGLGLAIGIVSTKPLEWGLNLALQENFCAPIASVVKSLNIKVDEKVISRELIETDCGEYYVSEKDYHIDLEKEPKAERKDYYSYY